MACAKREGWHRYSLPIGATRIYATSLRLVFEARLMDTSFESSCCAMLRCAGDVAEDVAEDVEEDVAGAREQTGKVRDECHAARF